MSCRTEGAEGKDAPFAKPVKEGGCTFGTKCGGVGVSSCSTGDTTAVSDPRCEKPKFEGFSLKKKCDEGILKMDVAAGRGRGAWRAVWRFGVTG